MIEDFADAYLRGETPIPCIRCNQTVKFRDLLDIARDLGAEAMATGHYVRRAVGRPGPELHRAADPARDQSYFLFATTAEQLDYLRFPLGGLPKPRGARAGRALGLPSPTSPTARTSASCRRAATPPSSTGCARGAEPGDIVHLDGRVLGRHEGVTRYTVGQRRGLALDERGGADPLFVVRLDAATRRVIVGPREALGRSEIALKEINWLGRRSSDGALPVLVRVRSSQPRGPPRPSAPATTPAVALRRARGRRRARPGLRALRPAATGSRVLGGGFIRRFP